ncbi:ADP-ribosylglycohydrolase [Amycolatopsis rhizosphaerae]|uniref:ADP-ribosylglycohydrolase n=1 Tax=Amycolatopsis rhizosphaerae TaxID=2053003 RepID=A0A558A758_9PSEU|nr:ADP-ribosylglycohydrolase family protein [Amycolatopsis rhizosphaerae]TVT20076.1 ADP-ribosylglycohydrolase [Amycolatopsis rhizosphaerae]
MEAAEAIAKVEGWLREVHAQSPNPVRVDSGEVRRVPEGWFVPYDSVAFLDEGKVEKRIFPPPALIVREPDGALRMSNPRQGGLSIPATIPGRPYDREVVHPDYVAAGLGRLGVAPRAVIGWEQIDAEGNKTGSRMNPAYVAGPIERAYPAPHNRLETLVLFAKAHWLDRDKFLVGLGECEVFIDADPVDDRPIPHYWDAQRRILRVFSAFRTLPPQSRGYRRTDIATLADNLTGGTVLIDVGWDDIEVRVEEIVESLSRFPRAAPRVSLAGPLPELDEHLPDLARRTAGELGLAEPRFLPEGAAGQARQRGFELTYEECWRTVLGLNWLKRLEQPFQGRRPPAAEIGLTFRYRADGTTCPALQTHGKYHLEQADEVRYGWHRVLGAYVGFAIGEALGSAVDTLSLAAIREQFGPRGLAGYARAYDRVGQLGPLTQQLLFLTEGAIRGPHREAPDEEHRLPKAIANAWRRWVHTQGIPFAKGDGWLLRVPSLYDRRRPDPAEFAAASSLVLGTPMPRLTGPGALLAALPAALTQADSETGSARRAARLIAGVTHRDETDLAATVFLAKVFQHALAKDRDGLPPWVTTRRVLDEDDPGQQGPEWDAIREMVREAVPDYHAEPAPGLRTVEQIGDGYSTLSVLGRVFAAVSGCENKPEKALLRAVNHSGRSGLTGALAGALIGARSGLPGLPEEWVAALELRELIENLASDAFFHFDRVSAPSTRPDEWKQRYPRW